VSVAERIINGMAQRRLTELEERILDYVEVHPSLKVPHIVDEFGWRRVTYLQRLFPLLDDPAAEVARPMLVRRLRRVQQQRTAARASRTYRQVG
jgi:hypothetical protein